MPSRSLRPGHDVKLPFSHTCDGRYLPVVQVETATREPIIVGYTTVEASTYWEACEKVSDQGVDIRLCVNYAIKATGQPAGSFQGVAQVPLFAK